MASGDLKSLVKEIKSMREAMDFMNEKFEAALKELKEARAENVEYKNNMVILKEEVINLKVQVSQLQNEQLQNNLEISGLPCRSDENCHQIAYNIIKQVYPEMKQDDIAQAHRIGSTKDKDGKIKVYRNLLVKLKERKVRNFIYRNKKKLKGIDTIKMGLNNEKKRIYINENLSYDTKMLFNKANQLRKQYGWRYIWTDFGKILARKVDNSNVIKIKTEKDLVFLK